MSGCLNIKLVKKALGVLYHFGGDCRQLVRGHVHELMNSRNSQQFVNSILKGIIILDIEHRFKDDPEFGKLLKQF
jgi:hypothetical protein